MSSSAFFGVTTNMAAFQGLPLQLSSLLKGSFTYLYNGGDGGFAIGQSKAGYTRDDTQHDLPL